MEEHRGGGEGCAGEEAPTAAKPALLAGSLNHLHKPTANLLAIIHPSGSSPAPQCRCRSCSCG